MKLDIRELDPGKVISLVIPPERQENQNVAKLKSLRGPEWRKLVDAVYREKGGTDLAVFYETLKLEQNKQDNEALAARSNMVRVVNTLHDPSSQLLRGLERALADGKLCVVDISQMRGSQGLALAGVILQKLFEHNQAEFTKKESRSVPVIAVVEEAQSVLGSSTGHGEGPFVAWVKEGRKYDLGAVLITQQPSSIPEEILSQGDNWFVFHLLSEGDLRAVKKANAHFSNDLLSSLLNEPIPGHGVFWSSSGATPYPIPFRALLFEATYEPLDPDYNQPGIECYASTLRGQLTDALDAAVEAVGGRPVMIAGTEDATETIKFAAISQLAQDSEFQEEVRSAQGIRWGTVQKMLAGYLPATIGDRFEWVGDQGLVVRALNEVLGRDGWASTRRAFEQGGTRSWITVTSRAKSSADNKPKIPADWLAEEDDNPPPEDGLF